LSATFRLSKNLLSKDDSGGLNGIREINLLDGLVNSPYHTFDKKNFYPTVEAMAVPLGLKLQKPLPFPLAYIGFIISSRYVNL
jgi:hypothetical protein